MKDVVEIFMGDLKCELERFSPKPGDVFVLTIPDEISWELVDQLRSRAKDLFPNNKVAVITGGMRVKLESESCQSRASS
jgi:hypothetical protein